MFDRFLDLPKLIKEKSLLFLGPRQTGKSTLVQKAFPDAHFINLLESDVFREYSTYPERLREKLPFSKGVIVIDEIQLAPVLLNEVHALIEKHKGLRFVLTGSSARRLRKGSVNLLAGRAWPIYLHPLVSKELELKSDGDWLRYINRGGLAPIFSSNHLSKELSAYVGTYLQEEIRAEGLVRSSERFSRFLDVSALCNGEVLNFVKVSNDCGVPSRTVQAYFKILEDTLIGHRVEPAQTLKRKNVATSKFYLFDIGVANYLLGRSIPDENSEAFGRVLEHLIFLEIKSYLDYTLSDLKINFWRSQTHQEVDFVIGKVLAIEVKASKNISEADTKSLSILKEETAFKKIRRMIVCREKSKRTTNSGVEVIPYKEFLNDLWTGRLNLE